MRCHGCQSEVQVPGGTSVGFRDVCDACGRDLHVCLNCAHHAPSAYNACRESSAERVLDAERGNRCDYFRPADGDAASDAEDERAKARSALDALFED